MAKKKAKGAANERLRPHSGTGMPGMLDQLINAIYSQASGLDFTTNQYNNPITMEPYAGPGTNQPPGLAYLNDRLIKSGSKQAQVEQLLQSLMKSPRYSKYGHPGPIR